MPGGVELFDLNVGEAGGLDAMDAVLFAGNDVDIVGDMVGGAIEGCGGLDAGILKTFGVVGAGERRKALAQGELRCDVFGLEPDLLVEVGGAHDVGALPGELRDAVGLAFLDGGGEVEVDAGGGDLGSGVGEVDDCGVEVAVVAVDVGDLVADRVGGI